MDRYCDNPRCENEATKSVRVSLDAPGDDTRALCAACDEVFAWGVQHGRMLAEEHRAETAEEHQS